MHISFGYDARVQGRYRRAGLPANIAGVSASDRERQPLEPFANFFRARSVNRVSCRSRSSKNP